MPKDNDDVVKLRVPEFRVSFPHLFVPTAMREGQDKKYNVAMLWDKKANLKELRAAIQAVITKRWGSKPPKNLKLPIHDGDEKSDLSGYAGCYTAAARSAKRPGLLNQRKEQITSDDGQIYAGCYAVATVLVCTFPREGEKGIEPGVRLVLLNVMKTRDGEEFSGRKSAEDDFADMEVEEDSENPANYEEADDDLSSLGL